MKTVEVNLNTLALFLGVLLFAGISSQELIFAWTNVYIERFSWAIFVVWCLPLLVHWSNIIMKGVSVEWNVTALVASIVFTLLGLIGTLNTLCYFGLACGVMALLPPRFSLIPWLLGSVLWMPAVGWFGIYYFPDHLFYIRISIVSICSLWAVYTLNNRHSIGAVT